MDLEVTLSRPDTQQTQVAVTCNDQPSHTFDLRTLISNKTNGLPHPIADPVAYGTALYAALFPLNSPAHKTLTDSPERILLVAADPDLDAIPWEYTFGPEGFLVCDLPFVRGLPPEQRIPAPEQLGSLHIVAVPSNPLHPRLAPATLVERLRELASRLPDHQIAERLNAEEERTPTGKPWTAARVTSLRKQHTIPTSCPIEPGAVPVRGDGLIAAKEAARRLQVSRSLVHIWVEHGVLSGDQRAAGSDLWVRLDEQEVARLSGQIPCVHFLSIWDLMRRHQCSAEEDWQYVRRGDYLPYRRHADHRWEWRFCLQHSPREEP